MKDNKKIIKIIKVIAIIIFAIIIIYFVHRLFKHSLIVKRIMRIKLKKPDIHKFRYIMSHHKYLVAVLFEVIFALKPLVFFVPSSLVCIFAGEYFGPLVGFLLNMVGIFLSSTTGFYFARILGQSFVNKILRGKSLKLDNNIEQKGFKIMFTMRVSMVFPHDALSYAAGLSKIKYKDFILATCLGMIPEVLAYSILGKSAEKILSIKFLIYTINKLGPYKYLVFAGLIILIAIIIYFHNKNKAKKASYIKDEEIIQEENDNIEK